MDWQIGFVFYYELGEDLSYVKENFSRYKETNIVKDVSEEYANIVNDISEEYTVVIITIDSPLRTFDAKFDINPVICLARISGNLIKAYLLEGNSQGDLVYGEDISFEGDTVPGMLNEDIFSIVSSQLTEKQKYNFKTTSKLYQKELSPVKWQVNPKGISSATFSSLREMYSLAQIVQLFIQFPDIVETCIDAGYDYKAKIYPMLRLLTSVFDSHTNNLLDYCINKVSAYDTAKMIIKRFKFKWHDYGHEDFEYFYKGAKVGKSKLLPKQQWEIQRTDESIELMLDKGFDAFSYQGKNYLFDLLSTYTAEAADLILFMAKQAGVEKDFNLPLGYILKHKNISVVISVLLCNPLLFSKDQILQLLKYHLLLETEEQQIVITLASIVAARGYSIEGIIEEIDPTKFIYANEHCLNILRCTRNGPLIKRIEDKFVQDYTKQRPEPEYVYYSSSSIKSNLNKKDRQEWLTNMKHELEDVLRNNCTFEELNNSVVEYVDYKGVKEVFIICPSSVENRIVDIMNTPKNKPLELEIVPRYLNETYDAYCVAKYLKQILDELLPNNSKNMRVRIKQATHRRPEMIVIHTDFFLFGFINKVVAELERSLYYNTIVIPFEFIFKTAVYLDATNIDTVLKKFSNHLLENGINKGISLRIDENNIVINTSTIKDKDIIMNLLDSFYNFYFDTNKNYYDVLFKFTSSTDEDLSELLDSIKDICDDYNLKPNLGYFENYIRLVILRSDWIKIRRKLNPLMKEYSGPLIINNRSIPI